MTNRTRRYTTGYCSLCFLTASVRSFVQVFLFSFSFVFFQEPRLTHQLLHIHLPLLPAPLHSWTGARRCHFPPEQTHETRAEQNIYSSSSAGQNGLGYGTFFSYTPPAPRGASLWFTHSSTHWMDGSASDDDDDNDDDDRIILMHDA